MKTKKERAKIFLVLVPHRDTRAHLQKYGEALFKAGLTGVFTFPFVVPLAVLSRPLDDDELKKTAQTLRKTCGKSKITASSLSQTQFSAEENGMSIFGPYLDPVISNNLYDNKKFLSLIFPSIAGICLIPKTCENMIRGCSWLNFLNGSHPDFPDPPHLSFRAAALANMHWKQITMDGKKVYKWKIGKLRWLPRV
ncbi:MAG: hypothetical protein FWB83_11850 [Treponema sp.]|nr:hypothetical protein [Treponema sp.]